MPRLLHPPRHRRSEDPQRLGGREAGGPQRGRQPGEGADQHRGAEVTGPGQRGITTAQPYRSARSEWGPRMPWADRSQRNQPQSERYSSDERCCVWL